MTTIEFSEMFETIDGIEYKFLFNNLALRITDLNSGENVALIRYPDAEKAQNAYRTATAAAWQLAASNLVEII